MTKLLTVPIKCIHARELLVTALARVRPVIGMQLLMPFTIVLPRETLAAPRPRALEWSLLIV
jgi:hypothetical protein